VMACMVVGRGLLECLHLKLGGNYRGLSGPIRRGVFRCYSVTGNGHDGRGCLMTREALGRCGDLLEWGRAVEEREGGCRGEAGRDTVRIAHKAGIGAPTRLAAISLALIPGL